MLPLPGGHGIFSITAIESQLEVAVSHSCGYSELNSGPLLENYMFLIAEPWLQFKKKKKQKTNEQPTGFQDLNSGPDTWHCKSF